jgi:carbohydrate-selective porin OprB
MKRIIGKKSILPILAFIIVTASAKSQQNSDDPNGMNQCPPWHQREKLDGGWWGAYPKLADQGLTVELSLTQIYQHNVRGGPSSNHGAGRYSGSYDQKMFADLEKLLGWKGAKTYMLTEGSWSSGINPERIGSILDINGDTIGDQAVQVSELWYEQPLFDKKLILRAGKIDLMGGFECRGCPVSFDSSLYANDETSQFLNLALINNPTIPFPDRGLGLVLHFQPVEGWYASVAVADAQADGRETGFNTTFHDEAPLFSIFETGIIPEITSGKGLLTRLSRRFLVRSPALYGFFKRTGAA